jgi:hypothetical protein
MSPGLLFVIELYSATALSEKVMTQMVPTVRDMMAAGTRPRLTLFK